MQKLLWAALAALCVSQANASELRLSFGESSLRGEYLQAIGQPVGDSATTLQAGLLYVEEDDSDGTLGHLGMLIFGDAGARKAIIQAGIGGRVYLLSTDPDLNGAALAMGGAVNGRVPGIDRLGGFSSIWYSPKVSAFGDLDGSFEFNIGIEYQLLRQAALSVGWRQVRFKLRDLNRSFDFEDSAFVGFKFLF